MDEQQAHGAQHLAPEVKFEKRLVPGKLKISMNVVVAFCKREIKRTIAPEKSAST
jgi:hypothetical protein